MRVVGMSLLMNILAVLFKRFLSPCCLPLVCGTFLMLTPSITDILLIEDTCTAIPKLPML